MNDISFAALGAIGGVTVGVFGTRRYFKKKFARKADAEIEEVKKTFRKHLQEIDDKITVIDQHFCPDDSANTSSEASFMDESDSDEENPQYGYSVDNRQSVLEYINADEYGSDVDYELVALTYYTDGVLADERGNKITDVPLLVGSNFADHFGEEEDDTVFVRNDTEQIYFEIALSQRAYSEVFGEDDV